VGRAGSGRQNAEDASGHEQRASALYPVTQEEEVTEGWLSRDGSGGAGGVEKLAGGSGTGVLVVEVLRTAPLCNGRPPRLA
jgi:hypothetical protein